MTYTLFYFPVRGRAQPLRYMCLDQGIALAEEVITDWPAFKPKTPLGQMPFLRDGTFELGQSNAIFRYVARKHGLYGKDDHEAAVIDMLNDQQEDLRVGYIRLIYAPYAATSDYDTAKADYIKSIPEKLAIFEKWLGMNHGGSAFFVGAKASFLDYTVYDILDMHETLAPHSLDAFSLLKAFHGRLAASPKIAAYRQTDAFKKLNINGNGKQ